MLPVVRVFFITLPIRRRMLPRSLCLFSAFLSLSLLRSVPPTRSYPCPYLMHTHTHAPYISFELPLIVPSGWRTKIGFGFRDARSQYVLRSVLHILAFLDAQQRTLGLLVVTIIYPLRFRYICPLLFCFRRAIPCARARPVLPARRAPRARGGPPLSALRSLLLNICAHPRPRAPSDTGTVASPVELR